MIVDELAARFGFDIVGLEKVRKAIEVFQRLSRAIALFAATVAKRLGRVALVMAKVSAGMLRFGAGFIARSALITGAAGLAAAGLAKLAAGFAKVRQESIDSARVNGIPIKELQLVRSMMTLVGASADDGTKFLKEFVEKLREGAKDGGDFADVLKKQGVRIKDAKGKLKPYAKVLDEIFAASDKIKDGDKKREFLKEALPGAPDEFISRIQSAVSALAEWKSLAKEGVKFGGKPSDGAILNTEDITKSMGRLELFAKGIKDAFGSGLMASFSQDFRRFGEYLLALPLAEIQAKLRGLGAGLGDFTKDIMTGGFIVLSKVSEAIGGLTSALSKVDDATGGRLGQIAKGLFGLGIAIGILAAGPAVAVATAITGLLFAVAKFQEWRAGGVTSLDDFFETLRDAADRAKTSVDDLMKSIRALLGLDSPEEQAKRLESGRAERDQQFSRMKDFNDKTKTPEQLDQYRKSNPAYADWERRQAEARGEKPQSPAAPAKAGEPGEPGLPADPARPAKPGHPGKPGAPTEVPSLAPRPRAVDADQFNGILRRLGSEGGASKAPGVERRPLVPRDKDQTPAKIEVPPGLFDGAVKALQMLFSKQAELSPEVQIQKIAKDREAVTNTDSRTYSDIGNDHRSMPVTIHQVLQQDAAAVANAARNAVLGAISTKGSNTSTGALTAP